jgi:hypothetical protein
MDRNRPPKGEMCCVFCHSITDVRLCVVEFVQGSAGVIRPVCQKCRTPLPAQAVAGVLG